MNVLGGSEWRGGVGRTLLTAIGTFGFLLAAVTAAPAQRYGRSDGGSRFSGVQTNSTDSRSTGANASGGRGFTADSTAGNRSAFRSSSLPSFSPSRSDASRSNSGPRIGANTSGIPSGARLYTPPSSSGISRSAREQSDFADIGRRPAELAGPKSGPGGKFAMDNPRGGGLTAPASRRAADTPSTSEIRQRIPDLNGPKAGAKLANDAPKTLGDRSKSSDFGARGVKLDGTGKLEPIKSPTERPNASEIRKRIPDLPNAKFKPADGTNKVIDGSKLPGKDSIDRGKVPDSSKRSGATPAGIDRMDRAKLPGKGNLDVGRLPDVGKHPIGKPLGEFKPAVKVNTPIVSGMNKGKVTNGTIVRAQFTDRVKKGDFEALSKSPVGQKIKLADQYRLAQQGDVARRLALHSTGVNVKNVTHVANLTMVGGVHGFHDHPQFNYHGWVSPIYHRQCFEYRSWCRPAWYPSIWWYPRWSPWLQWSWHHHCHPFWDPRPFWCRPVVYVVAPQPWIAWSYPAWIPLPEVSSGTWVDVQKPVVADQKYDLQLLAVRFVDPGHPDEKLGPRYRVWFRNNSNQPITKPFDVRLFATPGEQLAGNVPQAAVRVTAIEAGDTQSVDIRLPFEPAQAADPGGKAPFQFVHAMVDANREIQDVNQANNGARVAVGEILPVDPAAFEVDPKTVAAGGELVVAGEGLGPEPGKVILHLGNIEMEAEILGWYDLGVRLKMPDLPLADATQADLVVIRGDGAATNPVAVTVNPPQRP